MIIKCECCGDEFEGKSGRRFCSRNCRIKIIKPKTVYMEQRLKEIQPLLVTGIGYQEIANKFGVTKQQISLYAKQLGYRRRSPRPLKAYEGYRSTRDGYVKIYHNNKWVFEHRLIMEQHLGRPLLPSEMVHHINGSKDDNRFENFQIVTKREHMAKTVKCHNCPVMEENKRLHSRIRELRSLLQPPLDNP